MSIQRKTCVECSQTLVVEWKMELEEYLAIPYKLIMESFEGPDGDWLRRASYPELPGCDVEGLWAVDVVEALEILRIELITERFKQHEFIPVPRPPLRSHGPILDMNKLDFAKYLVAQGKISEG